MKFESFEQPQITDQNNTSDKKEKQPEKPETAERPEYDELKDYLKREQREISRPVIEEAKIKRDQLLEARGLLSMSKADFDANFSSKDFEVRADLKQQNVGDCYVVAAIYAMSRSPHFEMICRSSMKKLPDGSWQVRVPLMSENGQIITITPEELLPQKNRQFLKRSEKGGIMPDLRRKLMPVKGREGLQVLEAAFIKQKFGSVDRLAAEGGRGDEVLLSLGGDNFKKYSIDSATWNPEKKKWEYPGLGSLDEKNMAYLDHYLENFDPEVHMATVSTKHGVGSVTGFYRAKGTAKFLVPGHAYSISSVDAEKKMVSLANPWDTLKPVDMTFDQFKENFSGFKAIRIDSARLLKSMKGVEKKAA
ncbi:MAG: C2 family cysteine protease [Candidatus Azambacteria bacterium]|nr:C2 family cysteine protease [Candidatus Azambacteria bacterium]